MVRQTFVSIVIPAYNHGRYLRESIESVLNQSYRNLELIVINDGSTDETEAVLERFPKDAFTIISQENMGQANTLNKGWALACGEILGYLSADDLLYPNAVELAVDTLGKHSDAVISYCDFDLISEHSHTVRRVKAPEYQFERLLCCSTICYAGPGMFFRRAVFDRTKGWNPKFRQMPDADFLYRASLLGNAIRIPVVAAAFRVHDGSQTFQVPNSERADEPLLLVNEFWQLDSAEPFREFEKVARCNALVLSAALHLKGGRFVTACKRFRDAIRFAWNAALSAHSLRVLMAAATARIRHRVRLALSFTHNATGGPKQLNGSEEGRSNPSLTVPGL